MIIVTKMPIVLFVENLTHADLKLIQLTVGVGQRIPIVIKCYNDY